MTVEAIAGPRVVGPTAQGESDLASPRLAREWKTMSAMVRIYCRDQHQSAGGLAATSINRRAACARNAGNFSTTRACD
ncbi:hypothetical protein SBV1_2630046 [Verrucomicrobia bacterium]|nr:hypothetical protein SBV1_2630046 [Verrucomicrobiota bacterium]